MLSGRREREFEGVGVAKRSGQQLSIDCQQPPPAELCLRECPDLSGRQQAVCGTYRAAGQRGGWQSDRHLVSIRLI